MRKDIYISWDLSSLPPRSFCLGIAALLLLIMAPELDSENVDLTSYYPAPSGVYNKMITYNNAYLATNSGNVGVGTTNPAAKLQVASGNLIIDGIGGGLDYTPSPTTKGYLRINLDSSGCTFPGIVAPNSNSVCPSGYYATWTQGLYIDGFSYQNHGGNIYIALPGGVNTSQACSFTNTDTAGLCWKEALPNQHVTDPSTAGGWGSLSHALPPYTTEGAVSAVYCCPR